MGVAIVISKLKVGDSWMSIQKFTLVKNIYLVIIVIIKERENFESTSVGGLKISPVSRAARKVSVQGH